MQTFEVVGFDNGYDYVKVVSGSDKEGKKIFPSTTFEPVGVSIADNNITGNEFNINKMSLTFQGKEYYVGNYAVEQDPRGGSKDFNDDKFRNPSELVKLLAGISLYAEEKEIEIKQLVVGLNIENYTKYNEDMVNALQDKTFKYKINEEQYLLEVGNVLCIPQGVGAYYDQLLDYNGGVYDGDLLDARYSLIDVGGRTVDAFIAKGMDIITGTDIGVNYGMSDAFKEVSKQLGGEIPYSIIEQDYREGKTKTFWKGQKHNIDTLCKQSFNNLAERIYNLLMNEWDKQINRVEFVILCGGGSKYLEKYLSEMFDIEVKTANNAQFSNANGYYKIGIYNQQEQDKEDNQGGTDKEA